MSTPAERMTATPETTIGLEDFMEKATEEGCVIIKKDKQIYIGEANSRTGLTYPHIHVWRDGNIALSTSSSINDKIGKDETIEISKLHDASTRRGVSAGSIRNTIGWILASAS